MVLQSTNVFQNTTIRHNKGTTLSTACASTKSKNPAVPTKYKKGSTIVDPFLSVKG